MEATNPNFGKDPAVIAQPEVVPVADMPLQGINFLLDVVGFHNLVEHLCLIKAGLVDYEDFCYLVEKDIWDMAEEFSKWTLVLGCITFSLGCIKHLMGLMHWIQDCFHANDDPDSVILMKL